MTAPSLPPYYHVGIVVPDVTAAKEMLSEQLGVRWGPVLRIASADYRDGDGVDLVLPTTMCYTVDAPHLEVIEEVPGSVWECNQYSNLHHIGFWSDDLGTDGAALGNSGCPMQLCGRAGAEAPVSFAYHRNDLGVRIEIVNSAMREVMGFLFQHDDG
jgi:hypothetical protein